LSRPEHKFERASPGKAPHDGDARSASLSRAAEAERLAALPRVPPRDEVGPVFAQPWQAQAFAMAVELSEQGHFTWKEWAATLAQELKAAADRGQPDDGSRYYEHWLAALERLVVEKGLSDRAALAARREAWAEAYRRTPHGKPVELTVHKE
jgi:nitrile hydratase accessory protein